MGTISLNKIVSIEKGVKSSNYKEITQVHKQIQKTPLLSGLSRVYRPKDDDGDQFPAESNKVQYTANQAIEEAKVTFTRLFDVVATKDWGNCTAKANVVVDGEVLLKDVPVTYLLFLEKQLKDLSTFVEKIPVLDPSENWSWDNNQNCFRSESTSTTKTKKVPRVLVKYEATEQHAAQTEVFHEDIVQGTWEVTKFSGAIQATRSKELSERVSALTKAVKFAREEANSAVVEDVKVGDKVLNWIFK